MKTFSSQIESHTQIRHSFCSRMLMLMTTIFALVFVMIGLAQAASADTKIVTPITDCRGNPPGEPKKIDMSGQYRLDVNCSAKRA